MMKYPLHVIAHADANGLAINTNITGSLTVWVEYGAARWRVSVAV